MFIHWFYISLSTIEPIRLIIAQLFVFKPNVKTQFTKMHCVFTLKSKIIQTELL